MSEERLSVQASVLEFLENTGLSVSADSWSYILVALIILLISAFGAYLIAKLVLSFKVTRLVSLTKNKWDDELLNCGVFNRLAHFAPASTFHFGKYFLFEPSSGSFILLSNFANIYIAVTFYMVINALLTATESIYNQSSLSKKAPVTGFIQVARLIITIGLIFLIISLLLGKSPVYLLSGLTAVAAVLLLIFRDTILGFVAGIQIAANRMFNTGDWIEIPKFGVDGDIIQIGLTVVKVQNWDKTISTLPTYTLTTDAVKNWRGMQASGGRRIKRSILIDVRSIAFASTEQLSEWKKLRLLKNYVEEKEIELVEDSKECEKQQDDVINSRKLTNIGTFRAYVREYLKQHPDVHKDLTHMVRQLPPTEVGLPIEIYCFSNKQAWIDYEHVQSEIFDHLLSILPVFNLKVYQRVSN